ncbi:MAG: 4-phosphoerythronate dehydrogenase PdxB [Prevotellaceae bacterium]|nr:4-phosphoerythronate dehydrogenase PdxB [Prevotellaceae bacterium]
MKFVIDDKIPYIKGVLEPYAEVIYLPGSSISRRDVQDADGLIVRTRTLCNAALLKGSRIRFIATATIGYDHIDTAFCEKEGIAWTNAAGSNAQSVAQYIASALVTLSLKRKFDLRAKTIGIVGVGNVGKSVACLSEVLGMQVLLNDPPREEREGKGNFVPLGKIREEADIITFHTPLTKDTRYPTYHIAGDSFFSDLRRKPVIINSARGEVINTFALKNAITKEKLSGVVLDCWENEPEIDLELLAETDIGTPHIAGYSADGKANATSMSVQAVSRFFHLGIDNWKVENLPIPPHPVISMEKEDIPKAILHAYNIMQDDARLRKNPALFEKLRGNYPLRREYGAYRIKGFHSEIWKELGFNQQ